MAAFQIRQVTDTTLVMCGQSRSSSLSADLVIEAAKVGGCYQIDDVTLRLSQAECDTRLDCSIVVLREVRGPVEWH